MYEKAKTGMNALIDVVAVRTADIQDLVDAMAAGKLTFRPDASKYSGYNGKMITGLNRMLDGVINPLNVAARYVDQISKGEIPEKIAEEYSGDFNTIKNNLNACIDGPEDRGNCAGNLRRTGAGRKHRPGESHPPRKYRQPSLQGRPSRTA
jgi:hypothetical protein